MMPVPIIIPSSSSCDTSEGRKVFLSIKARIKEATFRIESIVKLVYRDDCYIEDGDILYDKPRKVHLGYAGVAGIAMFCFISLISMFRNMSKWYDDNEFNYIFNYIFSIANNDLLITTILIIIYILSVTLFVGLLFGRIFPVGKNYIKEIEITETQDGSVINFTLDDNMDYDFYLKLLKEFKIKNRVIVE